MSRELLKFRPGDCGLKIKKDGQMEVAGVNEESPMIDKEGKVNPALLFAAAWARKDQKVFEALIQNFKDAVFEGYFGPEAQTDYQRALKVQEEHTKNMEEQNVAVRKPEETLEYGNEFETHSDKPNTNVASGAVTFEQPKPGTTTWPGQDENITKVQEGMDKHDAEQATPIPMTVEEQLDRRDS
jgi:hypothetical protein|tara:strand:+ start:2867 stop:3418 length:552 start_codon:yes stop_codon:yes gene_type:complete